MMVATIKSPLSISIDSTEKAVRLFHHCFRGAKKWIRRRINCTEDGMCEVDEDEEDEWNEAWWR